MNFKKVRALVDTNFDQVRAKVLAHESKCLRDCVFVFVFLFL